MIEEALSRVGEFVEREIEVEGPPGLALAVTDRERTLAVRTYGYADLAARVPVNPQHLFQIGSIGKSFAAFLVMQEVEAGRLHLDAPATDYLPWLRVPSRFPPFTLLDLLKHTAGIGTGSEFSPGAEGEVFAMRNTEAAWAPGTRFYYSNDGYKIVGLILERVARQPYAELVRTRIFEALGMNSSEPAIVNAIRPRCAIGYKRLWDDRPEHRSYPWVPAPWTESTSADGSISSTAEDMAVYARLILNRGRGPGGPIVSEGSFDYMANPFVTDPEDPTDAYGLGLKIRTVGSRSCFGHSGGTLGYSAGMWSENGLGVVVLQNSEIGAWWLAPYVLEAVGAALKERDLPPMPPPHEPGVIENAADYVGTFRCGERSFSIEQDGLRLALDGAVLDRVDGDMFCSPHADFNRFFIHFGREAGTVNEACYGPEVFTNARHSGYAPGAPYPREWDTYSGHYRSHNPWMPTFRIFVRKGLLMLAFAYMDFNESEFVLTQLPNGQFAMGDTPERIGFDTIIQDKTHHAMFMNGDYYRTFTL